MRVPFGRRTCVGVILGVVEESPLPRSKLRRIHEVLDSDPVFPLVSLEFLRWAANYFHHPVGEVVLGALPSLLRAGKQPGAVKVTEWSLSETGAQTEPHQLKRAPRQAAMLRQLQIAGTWVSAMELFAVHGNARSALQALETKGLVVRQTTARRIATLPAKAEAVHQAGPVLNESQAQAVQTVLSSQDEFTPVLVDGVTGSGKTEVYLRIIERLLGQGKQALVLIPEIGLTPQLVRRFRERIAEPVAVLHSALPDAERAQSWLSVREGIARVAIGTRSSIFVPMPDLGVIIVDEEHDLSFKQQDGFRYSARDLAVVRAQGKGIPIILGSATPSLESLHNASRDRYREVRLPARAGGAKPPQVAVVDLRGQRCVEGLSEQLIAAIGQSLTAGEQSLLFLNRRGFAPVLMCRRCGWHGQCRRCDCNLVFHRDSNRLRCHHCGFDGPTLYQCPDCASERIDAMGTGTQRIDQAISARFPDARVERVDRDSLRQRGSLDALLERIQQGAIDVMIGTQMLAKGHHFPRVTTVGIIDGDGGLFGADFRAPERMAQLLTQVAGRAGRGDRPGRVLIQTHHPHHPLLQKLIQFGYRAFAEQSLAERQLAQLPPFSSNALLRAEAAQARPAHVFLDWARERAERYLRQLGGGDAVQLLGPVPAPMERRAGRYRAHLLVESDSRPRLQTLLGPWVSELEGAKQARRVRWSLDVDPQEMT